MSWTIPPRTLWLRWNMIACAVAIFIWSTPEEDRPIFPALLGAWLSASLLWRWLISRYSGRTLQGIHLITSAALFGAVSGALSNICAVLLMLFKDARHAHLFPDYPPPILGAMLARLPAWSLAGALSALGAALLLSALHRRRIDAASPDPAAML
jgi:hypothetical protein